MLLWLHVPHWLLGREVTKSLNIIVKSQGNSKGFSSDLAFEVLFRPCIVNPRPGGDQTQMQGMPSLWVSAEPSLSRGDEVCCKVLGELLGLVFCSGNSEQNGLKKRFALKFLLLTAGLD